MSFMTLVYHEIREEGMFCPDIPHPIHVKQNYKDYLPTPLFVTLEHFTEQMEYLFENGYHTLTLEEVRNYYYKQSPIPEKSVLLTFDDCYQSIARYAYPLLKKYGFCGTVFVVSGWLSEQTSDFQSEQSVCLTQEELMKMNDVFEYANHTDSFHTRESMALSQMMTADDLALSEDLDRCNELSVIQAKDVFAYPFGLYEERNVALLREKGFRLAFTTGQGPNDNGMNPLLLNRTIVPYFAYMDGFLKILGVI